MHGRHGRHELTGPRTQKGVFLLVKVAMTFPVSVSQYLAPGLKWIVGRKMHKLMVEPQVTTINA